MKEKLVHLLRRGAAVLNPLVSWFLAEGRISSFVRGAIFVGTASMLGLYLALTLFVSDEVVLGKIRGLAASRGFTVSAGGVGYSPFGSVTLDDVVISSTEGKELLTVGELSLSPRLLPLLRGVLAATVNLEDIDGTDGALRFSYDPGDDFCAEIKARTAPLTVLRVIWPEVELEGTLDGKAEFCEEQKKASAAIDLRAEGVRLGGVVYGLTLGKPVSLGEVVIRAETKEGKLEIEDLRAEGDLLLEVTGKVTLNAPNYKSSRLELSAHIEEKRSGALKDLSLLELALSRFKGANDTYAIKITGTVQNPAVRRDTASVRSSRSSGKEREKGAARRKDRDEKRDDRPSRSLGSEAFSSPEPPKGKASSEEKVRTEEPDKGTAKEDAKETTKEAPTSKETTETRSATKEETAKDSTKETEDNP